MSVQGHSSRFREIGCESVLPPRADIVGYIGHVAKVPTAEVRRFT
jgi:hypothetical protein